MQERLLAAHISRDKKTKQGCNLLFRYSTLLHCSDEGYLIFIYLSSEQQTVRSDMFN